jgi:ABC-type cobalamin/Fe3+-siderophores transport system ATPase subunit
MQIIQCSLKNGEKLKFGDINIFVGPNGVGKTTLMNELREFFCRGSSNTPYWITSLANSKLDLIDAAVLLKHIEEYTESDDQGKETKKYTFKHNKNITGKYDSSNKSAVYTEDVYKKLLSLSKNEESKADIQIPDGNLIHQLFIGYENTRERLNLGGEKTRTDTKSLLEDIINVIVQNKEFQTRLSEVFFRCFNRTLFFSTHRGSTIEILVGRKEVGGDEAKEFIEKTFVEAEKLKKSMGILAIDKAGDGMRAGAKLLLSLFDPESRIVFIDEPEVFIHPKQKTSIAKELIELARENKKQLFLSTHDASFLAGLIDNKENQVDVKIFYLKEHQKIISPKNFKVSDGGIRPGTKQQKYLQSLFHDGTIFVEGPNDRCFYENTIEELFEKKLTQKDIVYTEVAGVSSAMQVTGFVKDSGINAAFIFDQDIISKKTEKQQKLPQIYNSLGGTKDLEKMLSKLPDSKKSVIKELKRYGIFIVPNGELQSWSTKIKKDDAGFPYNLIEEMVSHPTHEYKVFANKILEYLIPREKKV